MRFQKYHHLIKTEKMESFLIFCFIKFSLFKNSLRPQTLKVLSILYADYLLLFLSYKSDFSPCSSPKHCLIIIEQPIIIRNPIWQIAKMVDLDYIIRFYEITHIILYVWYLIPWRLDNLLFIIDLKAGLSQCSL